MFIFDVRKQKWTVVSVILSLRVTRASGVWACGPLLQQVVCESCWCCVTVPRCESEELESSEPPAAAPTSASTAVTNQRGELGAVTNQPARWSFQGILVEGLEQKPTPTTPETLLLHPPSPSSPQPSGFDILDPCMEEYPPLFIPLHTHPTSIQIIPWIMIEKWHAF